MPMITFHQNDGIYLWIVSVALDELYPDLAGTDLRLLPVVHNLVPLHAELYELVVGHPPPDLDGVAMSTLSH